MTCTEVLDVASILADMAKPSINASKLNTVLDKVLIYVVILLLGYGAADLTALSLRSELVPSEKPPAKPPAPSFRQASVDYSVIERRNVFLASGKNPAPLSADTTKPQDLDGPATKSDLPIRLVGTIVHANPKLSVATLGPRGRGETKPYFIGDRFKNDAELLKVERRRVIIRNLRNQRTEFIEIPKDAKITFGLKSAPEPVTEQAPKKNGIVTQTSEYEFSLPREEVLKQTQNLSGLLSQARVVRNIGSDGSVRGFKFSSIKPGSLFEQLGLKVGDVILGVNGEDINSPAQGMSAYNALKDDSNIKLNILRNGREEEVNYTVR
ncbi:MAG: hypothetical protein CL675_02465 [Bdellovibrionaceae bacterium]|nr:hypothetical protein [Pseudobdellovibrionaceae bacterium]